MAILEPEERAALRRAVFNERLYEVEVLSRIIREHLDGKRRELDDEVAWSRIPVGLRASRE